MAAADNPSGRSNEYLRDRGGVLVANWFEERCAARDAPPPAAEFQTSTTLRDSQRVAASGARPEPAQQAASRFTPGAAKTSLTAHGEPGEAPAAYWATLNSLAYSDKFVGMPRVQEFLFSGKNRADAKVQVSGPLLAAGGGGGSAGGLGDTKRAAWAREAESDPWATTTRSALQAVALAAARGRA